MSSKLTTDEILTTHLSMLQKWRAEGLGGAKISVRLSQATGKECTRGVANWAIKRLDAESKSRATPLPITEQDEVDCGEMPIEELIESRVKASERKRKKFNRHRRTISLPAQPTGLFIFGDPHVDNDGCDWATLYEHVHLAQSTEGVLAACVGDMQDNWIGRLSRIYSEASITASDGWRLSEWYLRAMQWVAIVGGNHDAWANGPGVDPMKWLTEKCGVPCYAPDELRITLKWKDEPDLDPVVWILRHDFGGRSWFHPTHGPHKEAMLDGKCHLLTAGHIHQWGELTTEQRHARVTSAVRVRGYKRQDAFAMQKGFSEQQYGEAALVVIDPFASGAGRVAVFWDLQRGCDYLTYLRSQYAEEAI